MAEGFSHDDNYGDIQGLKNHLIRSIINTTSAYASLCDLDSHFREYGYRNGENGCPLGPAKAREEMKKLFDKYRTQGAFAVKEAIDNLASDQVECISKETLDEWNVIKKIMIE
jgi:hypothetical protein